MKDLKIVVEDIKHKLDEIVVNIQDVSDGYHSFDELYEFRFLYNAMLFNEWTLNNKYDVHKSLKHTDGELCFNGEYFIVIALLPTGMISNHYPLKYWNYFKIPEFDIPKYEYDGHTVDDVKERIFNILK